MSILKSDLISEIKTVKLDGNSITFSVTYSKKSQMPYVIILLHGGFNFPSDATKELDMVSYARAGFICLGIKYPENNTKNISLPKDVAEVIDLAEWAWAHWPKLKGLFLIGVSRGGFVAYHALSKFQDGYSMFNKTVVCCGPTDLPDLKKTTMIPQATLKKMWPYFNWANNEISSSPTHHAKAISKHPLFLAYGKKDMIVPIAQGNLMW